MREILRDRNAQLQCETQIKESQRYIDYFGEELRRLQAKGSRASFSSSSNYFSESAPLTEGSTLLTQQLVSSPNQSLDSPGPEQVDIEEDISKRYTNLGKESCIHFFFF